MTPENYSQRLVVALPTAWKCAVLALCLQVAVARYSAAEEHFDLKAMKYQEDNDRVGVFATSAFYKNEFTPEFSIQVDGIYNSISGATPTGAPPETTYRTEITVVPATPDIIIPASGGGGVTQPPAGGEDDDEDEEDDDDERYVNAGHGANGPLHLVSGATQVAPPVSGGGGGVSVPVTIPGTSESNIVTQVPAGTQIPKQQVTEERYGANVDLTRKFGDHAVSGKLSYSTEHDYQSIGVALSDTVDFDDRNTLLTGGLAYTYDIVKLIGGVPDETKRSTDIMVGVTRFFDKRTVLTLNMTIGVIKGYLTDQYKLTELNGEIVQERRPGEKTKQAAYLGLTRHVDALNGTAEASYRFYQDSFDAVGHTAILSWYQELTSKLTLRPSVRFYDQSASSFYDVRFTGTPEFFSSDYRISAFQAVSYGGKLIWFVSDRFSIDAAYERYEQKGTDGKTDGRMYPSADIVSAGMRIWL